MRASFKERLNRFLGLVEINGKSTKCFIPNPGRMKELLFDGAIVYITEQKADYRKTNYDLVLVELNGTLISIDSRIPNKLLKKSINNDLIKEFEGFKVERTEPPYENSRFDLLLTNGVQKMLLEAKSCTLVKDRIALFPDAPTKRGVRHLKTLVKSLDDHRASITFIIQRNDVDSFQSNIETDPLFAETLACANARGVEVYAYLTEINLTNIKLGKRIKVTI